MTVRLLPEFTLWRMWQDGRVVEARTRIVPLDGRPEIRFYVSRADSGFDLLWSMAMRDGRDVNELAHEKQREFEVRGWTLEPRSQLAELFGRTFSDSLVHIAYHEAAHGVVQYRVVGFVGGHTTIVSDPETGTLGHLLDCYSDTMNEKHMRARILSCYAGAHADLRRGCFELRRYGADEGEAAEQLRRFGWEHLEGALRAESAALVETYWTEIEAVAAELFRRRTLDKTEVEIVADLAAGASDLLLQDLDRYRLLRAR